jgi:hypothetical protein
MENTVQGDVGSSRYEGLIAPIRLNVGTSEKKIPFFIVCAGLLIVAMAVRIHWAIWIDPFTQHDPRKHLQALAAILQFRIPAIDTGPYYYMVVAFVASPLVALRGLNLLSNKTFLTLTVAWSSIVFQSLYMYGCLLLARRLRFRLDAQLLFVGLCTFFPPIQRSLATLRPENLILTLTPYVCVYSLAVWHALRSQVPTMQIPATRPAAWIAILMAAQKVSGLFLVVGLAAASLAFVPGAGMRARLKQLRAPARLIGAALIVVFVCQRLATGYWFFESEQFAYPGYETPPKLELFTNFDPARAWRQPFRNEHKDSMLNILFIDMFGDYWRYGIDHYAYTDAANNNLEWRRFRARFGIVAATLFLAFYVAGVVALAAAMIRATAAEDQLRSAERAALSVLFFVGILMLMIATLPGYAGEKLDIMKWEYIAPFVPFLMIPPAHLLDQAPIGWARRIGRLILACVIVLGIVQSIRFIPLG